MRDGDFDESPSSRETAMTQEERNGGDAEDIRKSIEGEIGRDGDVGRGEDFAR